MTATEVKVKVGDLVIDEADSHSVPAAIVRIVQGPEDPTGEQQMKIVEVSGTLDFWNRSEEDGYTHDDGEPVEMR